MLTSRTAEPEIRPLDPERLNEKKGSSQCVCFDRGSEKGGAGEATGGHGVQKMRRRGRLTLGGEEI